MKGNPVLSIKLPVDFGRVITSTEANLHGPGSKLVIYANSQGQKILVLKKQEEDSHNHYLVKPKETADKFFNFIEFKRSADSQMAIVFTKDNRKMTVSYKNKFEYDAVEQLTVNADLAEKETASLAN